MRLRWRSWLVLLVASILIGSAFGADGLAEESAMLHIRARSQLHLREAGREQKKGIYRLNVLLQLSDNGEDKRASEAAAKAEGGAPGRGHSGQAGAAQRRPGPARSRRAAGGRELSPAAGTPHQ